MQLTKEQKQDLKLLVEHRGFKVLEQIAKEEEYNLLSKFKKANLGTKDIAIELSNAQNKLLWMETIINTAKGKSQDIAKVKQ